MFFNFAKRLWQSRFNRSARRPQRASRPRRASIALGLEALEERWLPNATVITVTTAADDPTTPIAGQTTLRDAINQANQTTGATIQFAQSLNGQIIQPTTPLPAITGAGTTIDAPLVAEPLTPDGSNSLQLLIAPRVKCLGFITLDGSKAPPIIHGPGPDKPGQMQDQVIWVENPDGLDVEAGNVTIEGLSIVNWSGNGIKVESDNSSVSNTMIARNYIENNGEDGVLDIGSSNTNITGNTIQGNSENGVEASGGNQCTIRYDTISGNNNLGIQLDGTSNNSITAPVLLSEESGANNSGMTIQGYLTLPSAAPFGAYTLDIFANTTGSNPQGELHLGTIEVMAGGGMNTPFTYVGPEVVSGLLITATVTDPNGDTSEFSNALTVIPPASPSPPPSPSPALPPSPSPPLQSPPTTPATPPPSFVQASVTLYIDGAELLFDQLARFGNPNLAGVNASIAANSPYAGAFADWFVLAGETLMAEQLSAAK